MKLSNLMGVDTYKEAVKEMEIENEALVDTNQKLHDQIVELEKQLQLYRADDEEKLNILREDVKGLEATYIKRIAESDGIGGRKMTLLELQNILGERINVTLRTDLTTEEREIENAQSALINEMAKQMINNGDLILRTEKLASMSKSLVESAAMKLIYGDDKPKYE